MHLFLRVFLRLLDSCGKIGEAFLVWELVGSNECGGGGVEEGRAPLG